MNKKLLVAEALLDSASDEYRHINLANIESVQDYAENGMNITLSDEEAKQVLEICKAIDKRQKLGEIISSNDWHYDFEEKLA